MPTRALVLASFLVAALGAGCEDAPPPGPDLSPVPDLTNVVADLASNSDGASGPLEFADFVVSLITTQTSDSTRPTPTEDKTFVDSMDPTKFLGLF